MAPIRESVMRATDNLLVFAEPQVVNKAKQNEKNQLTNVQP
jgi:hypothetical protein